MNTNTRGKPYYGKISLQTVHNSHTQTFRFLREYCRDRDIQTPRVLEVGCSSGYFSQFLKDNGAFVYGIEPFTDEAEKNGHVDGFFFGTVEEFIACEENQKIGLFDALIFGDTLEHLLDPETVLRRLLAWLRPEGVVLISVPNVTHISIRRMLEDGQWLYRSYGLLDGTHLRFFTRHSLRKMLVNAGLGIECSFHVLTPGLEEYPTGLKHRADNQRINEQDHTYQIVVRASRQALPREAFTDELPRRILLLSPGYDMSLTSLRLIQPLLAYCREVGGELRADQHISDKHLRWADVLVAHRECFPAMMEVVRRARSYGISVVYDLDDLLYELPPWSLAATSPEVTLGMRYMAATADVATCSTPALRDELKKLSGAVKIVRNSIICDKKIDIETTHTEDNTCTLVVASSDTVVTSMLLEPLKLFFEETRSKHTLLLVGPIASSFTQNGLQGDVYDACMPKAFSEILLRVKNGIGLIPLDDSLFSSCKSSIKFQHYTACGIVCAASAVMPYTQAIQHESTGILVPNTTEGWLEALHRLTSDTTLRRRFLAKAFTHCQRHAHPAQTIEDWKKAFYGLPRPDQHYLKKA